MISHQGLARRIAPAIIGLGIMLLPTSASAGRLVASGHDSDHHCGRETEGHQQCHFFQFGVSFVRAGAPDPAKPVLVLDRGPLDVVTSLDRVFGPGAVPRVVVSPQSPGFASTPIDTSRYSAVIIASSGGDPTDATQQDLNELTSTPDSDAINRREPDLRAFFDAGGGIFVGSGNRHGDAAGDPYYGFLPLTVQGARVTYPFTLTPAGLAQGLVASDVSCCPTHNTFAAPSVDSALVAIDTDKVGRVVSVVADTKRFSSLGEPPLTPAVRAQVAAGLPTTKSCLPRKTVTLRLRRLRHVTFTRATVFVNGRVVKRLKGKKITRPIKLKVPAARRATMKVRVVIRTKTKKRITIKRTYKTCS